MKSIKTSNGYLAKVDEIDFEFLVNLCNSWYADKITGGDARYAIGYPEGQRGLKVKMHKVIAARMNLHGLIDHKNRDSLDNRRENLREVTPVESSRNRNGWGVSGVKGVYRRGRKWRAAIRVHGRLIVLGTFDTQEDAYTARVTAEQIYFEEAK